MRVEHLDALAVQGADQALVQPGRDLNGLCGSLWQDPVFNDRFTDPWLGEEPFEGLDCSGGLVDTHR